jgi:hypothetical protein
MLALPAGPVLDLRDELAVDHAVDACEQAVDDALQRSGEMDTLLLVLHALGTGGSEACMRRAAALYCQVALAIAVVEARHCRQYLARAPAQRPRVMLMAAGWPQSYNGPDVYLGIAELAREALVLPRAVDVAIVALENHARALDCQVMDRARVMAIVDRLGPTRHPRLGVLRRVLAVDVTRDDCRRRLR